jgi:small neutral amino acid transporter SnatA (MarC family)
MRWEDLHIGKIIVGIFQLSVAIVSVVGTLALLGWILKMIFTKDKRDELN